MARAKYFNPDINDWEHADRAYDSGGNSSKYPDWSHLKWYVIGDSLTAKNSSNDAIAPKRYYDFVHEKTGIQLVIDGVGGTGYAAGKGNATPNNFVKRVENAFPKNDPTKNADIDIVTIFGSGNDVAHDRTNLANSEVYAALSHLCFNRPGLRVIVVPPSPWTWKYYGETEDAINQWKANWKTYCNHLKECAVACNFRYVSDMYDCPPFNPNFTGHIDKFFTTGNRDGIHPDINGHEALAPYFYNAMLQELVFKE